MWVARNKDGQLQLFIDSKPKPDRDLDRGIWDIFVEENGLKIGRNVEDMIYIDPNLFKEVTWNEEPIEVKLEDVTENKKFDILMKFMEWLEKRGIIKDDLCFSFEAEIVRFFEHY